jgi:hypothetical protein
MIFSPHLILLLVIRNEKEVGFPPFEQNGTQKRVWTLLIKLLMKEYKEMNKCV